MRLEAVDPVAEAAGLAPGMTLSDAKARVPELITADADPAADQALLKRLAEACRRYTPAVAPDTPDGVCLDIAGTELLWDGEDALAADLLARMGRLALSARIGVADTPGLAWALARFGTPQPVRKKTLPSPLMGEGAGDEGDLHDVRANELKRRPSSSNGSTAAKSPSPQPSPIRRREGEGIFITPIGQTAAVLAAMPVGRCASILRPSCS